MILDRFGNRFMRLVLVALLGAMLEGCSGEEVNIDMSDPAWAEVVAALQSGQEISQETEAALMANGGISQAFDVAVGVAEPDNAVPEQAEGGNDAGGSGKPVGIVWLGDSLTQGSLGDIDDNLANAPYVRLQTLCGDRALVEGFGYYAFVSNDIFWRYCYDYKTGEAKDPEKVYVIWVGSNDFALAQDKSTVVAEVEAEIDKFVGDKISRYIVLSHLPRAESMPGDWYKVINAELAAHYGDRFLDITSCASVPDGFLPDEVHLTQESYDNVAAAVYNKLIQMGYI